MPGHLIRKRNGNSKSTGYIVATDDAAEAVDIIKQNVGEPGDHIQHLGPVSDGLLQALALPVGGFVSLDKGRASAPMMPPGYTQQQNEVA
ncbi:MAG TPA: hypothetical protein VL048_14145 [Xanthobacteraceae bacterium]|nr:hypothetical protein [Xanthobacteraceae bacterium]